MLAALDEAVRAGLIHDAAGSRQRFTHGLVKDVVYGALPAARLEWARALLATSQGRPEEVAGLLDQALTAAGAVGALTVERRAKALLAAATG